jgi:hypothetical protein
MTTRRLTTHQRQALLWADAHDGRLADELHHATLHALCNRKLVAWCGWRDGGYGLTEQGRRIARELTKEHSP